MEEGGSGQDRRRRRRVMLEEGAKEGGGVGVVVIGEARVGHAEEDGGGVGLGSEGVHAGGDDVRLVLVVLVEEDEGNLGHEHGGGEALVVAHEGAEALDEVGEA